MISCSKIRSFVPPEMIAARFIVATICRRLSSDKKGHGKEHSQPSQQRYAKKRCHCWLLTVIVQQSLCSSCGTFPLECPTWWVWKPFATGDARKIRLSCFLINGWHPELQGSIKDPTFGTASHPERMSCWCWPHAGCSFWFFIARDPLPSQMFHCATMLNYVVFYMCLKGLRTQRKGLAQGAALPLRVFWSRPARINAKSCNICQFSRECARILPECQEDLPLAWILEDLRSPQHRWRLLRTPRWWPN